LLWLGGENLSLGNLLAFLLCNRHLGDNLNWLRGNREGLDWLLLSINSRLLLDSLLNELLGLLEELELGQFLLEELDSADLVDAGEDEEKNDWAHGVHLWPVLDGILIFLVSHHVWTVMTSGLSSISYLSAIPESWSIDSVNLLLEVKWVLLIVELVVVVIVLLIIFVSFFLELMFLGVVVFFHFVHHFFEVIWDLLVESSVVLHIDLIEHFLLLMENVIVLIALSMVSCSKVSLWLLSNVGSHVENGSISFVVSSSQVVVGLNVFEGSLEESGLLPGENVEDEEGEEHEEMSVEHSFGNSGLLLLGGSKCGLTHGEEEERDQGGEEGHVPDGVVNDLLRSGLSVDGHVGPVPVSVVGITPWDRFLLDNEDRLESSISHLFHAHEHAHESETNEQVRAVGDSRGFVLNVLLRFDDFLIQSQWSLNHSLWLSLRLKVNLLHWLGGNVDWFVDNLLNRLWLGLLSLWSNDPNRLSLWLLQYWVFELHI